MCVCMCDSVRVFVKTWIWKFVLLLEFLDCIHFSLSHQICFLDGTFLTLWTYDWYNRITREYYLRWYASGIVPNLIVYHQWWCHRLCLVFSNKIQNLFSLYNTISSYMSTKNPLVLTDVMHSYLSHISISSITCTLSIGFYNYAVWTPEFWVP